MPKRNIIFWIIYVGLAATSLLFVQKTINDYLEEKTDYHKSYSPTTMKDFPTLTICLKHRVNLKYGTDFSVGLYQNYSEPDDKFTYVPLKEGENEVSNFDGITHNLDLKNLVVKQWYAWADLCTKCVKLTRKPSPLDVGIDHKHMYIHLKVEFMSVAAPLESSLYVTSEANAYGATYEEWYDGQVVEYMLKSLTLHRISMRVEEIHRIQGLCQDQSYYECLASKFVEDKSCKGLKCLPYTLPTSADSNGLEHCTNKSEEQK